MKRSKDVKIQMMKGLLLGALVMAATPASAVVDYYLAAKAYTKTMPDGTTVPMWGYVEDTGAACYNATGGANGRLSCVTALPDPTLPGPRLMAGATDPNFRIFLTNGLPEPTSIVISGQQLPWSSNNQNIAGPVWDDGSHGPRGTDLTKKVRSFGSEANPNGGRRTYIWTNFRATPFVTPGSFVYHSGTHPQKQVYMGLYGAVTKDAVAAVPGVSPAVAYNDPADGATPLASTSYDQEVVLFYSDIDPVVNKSIAKLYDPANPDYADVEAYTTSVDINAQWFLVNGEPYDPANKADPAMTIPAGAANTRTLVRLLSAASETHVPTLQGLYMDIHAEDGLVYNYQDATGAHAAPRTQYSANLSPLKTMDAIIVPQLEGTYAVYDGNGYMTNPSDINDFNVGDTVGGMLRFLSVDTGANRAPVAVDDPDATTREGVAVEIAVLANDTDPDNDTLAIATFDATATGLGGTVACVTTPTTGGNCTYTPPATGTGTDTFTYTVTDGVATSAAATVTITVNANGVPVAVDDPDAATDEGLPVDIAVLANDTDADNDTLAIATFDATATGLGGTVACVTTPTTGGTCTYTPPVTGTGTDTFTYTATDGIDTSAAATVTVTVNAPVLNTPPVATGEAYSTDEDIALNIAAPGVLENDTDAESNPLSAVLQSSTSNGSLVLNADGSFSYTPNANFNGSDAFTYVANDGTADSNTATVTITVNAVNDAPVAANDSYSAGEDTRLDVVSPGVLGNDSDVEGDLLTAVLGTGPSNGTVVVWGGDGSFSYVPTAGFVGTDSFTYAANDGAADSNTATVTIEVTALNDAPVAVNDTVHLNSMVTTIVAAPGVLANDTDPEGDTLTAVLDPVVEQPPELTAFNANGSFAYTLDIEDGRVGTIGTFEYLANDGQTNSTAPATVTLLRNLSVSQAVCEWEPQQGGRCDWSIQGNKLNAGRVQAFVAGTNTLIGQTGNNTGAGAWTITSNNNTQVNPAVGTSIAIDVRVVGDADAEILGYPTVSQ